MNRATGLLTLLLFATSAFAGDAAFEIRLVVDDDTPGAVKTEYLQKGEPARTLYLDKEAVVTAAHLSKAGLMADTPSGFAIEIQLNPTGSELFANLTRDAVGKMAAVIANGKVLTAPVVRVPITEGHLIISGSFTKEEAQAIVDSLNAAIKK